jgi:hypothetical protein
MKNLAPLVEAFDYLDIVLALVGVLLVSLWFGHDKSIWAILLGALTGGLVKPALTVLFLGGAFIAVQDVRDMPLSKKSQTEQDRIVKLWTEPHRKLR